MTSKRWDKIKQIFHSALELNGADRDALLESAGHDDPDVRAEVHALLAAHESAPTFLNSPVSCTPSQLECALGSDLDWCRPHSTASPSDDSDSIPERIAQFRIERIIASGGMGTVYEATQESPRRVVAVKLMKAGIASRSALRRFEYEGQILARLRHPGIAQIYEAGTHRDANGVTPFFAMEYIPGAKSITAYARDNSLDLRARICLFIQLCEAVHHGHQKGIIHRDLKPGNILVDSSGQVKVIDFGIARSTDSDLAITTLQTDVGRLIGTLQYMSPEQCAADAHDIDTRSDVYTLGVVLYQLVTDQLPYDVSQKELHEAVRLIREAPPAGMHTLSRSMRGDLETITLKALEKDRDRRYQTSGDLLADLKRYLAGEPIEAKRNSGLYLLAMFARRNRVAVLVAFAFGALLATSSITLAYMYAQQVQLRKLAQQREEETQQVAEFQAAQLAGIDARAMGAGLREDLLDRAEKSIGAAATHQRDPAALLADFRLRLDGVNFTDLALRSLENNIFQPSAQAIEEQFSGQPLIQARLLQTLADASTGLGLLRLAMPYQTEALDIRKRILGEQDPETLTSLQGMGFVYRLMGKFDEATSCYRRALELRRRVLGNDHPDTLQSMESVGYLLQWTGHLDESLDYREEVLAGRRRVLGNDHPHTLDALDALCSLRMSMKQYEMALPYCNEALQTKRRLLGSDTHRTMISISNMAAVLKLLGRNDEALSYGMEALSVSRRVLGDDHPGTLMSINNVGTILSSMNRRDEALTYYEESLSRRRKTLGDDHRDTLASVHNMGKLLQSMGRTQEALHYFQEAYDNRRRVLGEDDPETVRSRKAMASLLEELADSPEKD